MSVARPSSDCIKGANLYVGGLPKHVTNQDLINWFAPCGQIITARVLSDPQTGAYLPVHLPVLTSLY